MDETDSIVENFDFLISTSVQQLFSDKIPRAIPSFCVKIFKVCTSFAKLYEK